MKSLSALCVALCVGAPLLAQQDSIGAPPGRLVDIGGRKLHLHCTGTGAPTVVIEAGASAFAIDFALVQPEIARTNRVCSYDRAGHGWSDAAPAIATGVPQDLHALLQAAQEKPPYIMVGASMGGVWVRRYQIEYPDEVVGMVLIDPSHEDRLFTLFEGNAVTIGSLTADQYRSTIPDGTVRIPRRSPQTGAPFDRLPRELYELRVRLDRRLIASIPSEITYETRVQWAERERATLAKLREVGKAQLYPLGDRPVVALSRGIGASQEMWDVHALAARISSNSRHTIVTDSGHEIHLFRPDVVIQAIHDVRESLRTKAKLPERR
jgi:pimeloyl-ACP methyl ester carboxylesterase